MKTHNTIFISVSYKYTEIPRILFKKFVIHGIKSEDITITHITKGDYYILEAVKRA